VTDYRNRALAGLAVAGAVVAGSLGFAGSATAEPAPVAGGTTTLKPDKDTFEALSDMGITVVPTNGAEEAAKGIEFPIVGGKWDPETKTKLFHTGGIRFESTDAKLKVKDLIAKSNDANGNALVKASTRDAKIELLDLDLSEAKFRNEFTVKNIHASLTDEAAAALTDTFGQEIPAGTPIGKLIVKVELAENK